MKFILTSIFFIFLSSTIQAQIKISGTKEVKTENHNAVEFVRKEVEITKSVVEDNTSNSSNAIDPIEEIESSPRNVVLETPVETNNSKPKQIVVDLNEDLETGSVISIDNQPGNKTITNISEKSTNETNQMPACNKNKLNSWALGFQFGSAYIQGDVRANFGYGGALSIQKGFSRKFSLRYQGIFMETFGQDWKLKASNTNYLNYKTRITDHSIQALVTLNKKQSGRVNLNLIAGAGFSTKISWTNAFDENGNIYDYTNVVTPVSISDKGDVLESIKEVQDNGYETIIAANQLKQHIKNTEITPSVILGLGANFKLSDRVALSLEHRVSWHNADNLDNYEANAKDLLHFSSLGLQFTLGKNDQALWWKNKQSKCSSTSDKTSTQEKNDSAPTSNELTELKPIEKVEPVLDEVIYNEQNIIGFIFFDANSSKIKEEYYSELYKLNLLFEQEPNIKIQIIGHADVKGSEFNNKNIAKDRANSLFHFLTGILKMDPSKFEVSSIEENQFNVPEGFEVDAKNQSQMNRSITLIYKL